MTAAGIHSGNIESINHYRMQLLLYDYILEPVAIKLDYWQWTEGQIPVYNFICWMGVSYLLQWIYQRMKLAEVNKVAESLFLMMFIFFTLLML